MENLNNMFGKINEEGNVDILNKEDGSAITRIDENVYPVNSEFSARHEHPTGIILTVYDVKKLGISIEL